MYEKMRNSAVIPSTLSLITVCSRVCLQFLVYESDKIVSILYTLTAECEFSLFDYFYNAAAAVIVLLSVFVINCMFNSLLFLGSMGSLFFKSAWSNLRTFIKSFVSHDLSKSPYFDEKLTELAN